ncbi:MAG: hypothetical protein KGZ89_08150 [Actinobacteria bacterium]|nr:hypothetical protein [Actinomycetota bacterium]
MINYPLTVEVNGRIWRLYSVDFDSDDSVYSIHLYAINKEHASYRLQDLKDTGRLSEGEIVEISER